MFILSLVFAFAGKYHAALAESMWVEKMFAQLSSGKKQEWIEKPWHH